MQLPPRIGNGSESVTGGLPVPPLAKVGALVIAIGLLADTVVHALIHHVHDEVQAGFPVDEHLAHLVVVVGMVLVLAGVIADGVRTQRRLVRQEGTTRDAIR